MDNALLKEIVDSILQGTDLVDSLELANTLFIRPREHPSAPKGQFFPQISPRNLQGKNPGQRKEKEPLVAATVQVKERKGGTTTDSAGYFFIIHNIPSKSIYPYRSPVLGIIRAIPASGTGRIS